MYPVSCYPVNHDININTVRVISPICILQKKKKMPKVH